MNTITTYKRVLSYGGLSTGLILMIVCFIKDSFLGGIIVGCIPLFLLYIYLLLIHPYWGLVTLLILNYFIVPTIRYTHFEGLSVVIDLMIVFTLIAIIINSLVSNKINWKKIYNKLIFVSSIWLVYCCLEILNPTADTNAWILSRGFTYYFFAITLLTLLLCERYNDIKRILYIWSVLTLIGVAKGFIQHHFGFDSFESAWLHEGGGRTHLLITGTRYFSIYASAGIFGAVMGHAFIIFLIASFYMKKKWIRIYFFFVAFSALYGLIISGTRGAIAIPLAGIALWTILSKKIMIFIPGIILLICIYVFFAHTFIGQSNPYIRRIRTAFDPNEPSLVIRRENQKLFKAYLKDKPFGEGLGLSGVDVQDKFKRYTTSIPTDSWYVKIWVETGIIGLLLHIGILLYIIIHGAYIIMFHVKNRELKGILCALLCGVFGVIISSYGNQIFGQFPIVFFIYTSITFVFVGKELDQQITNNQITKI